MKKLILSFGLLALVAGASFSLQSCNKIKDEIAKQIDPFNFTEQDITYDVPVLTMSGTFVANDTDNININQMIKDEAGVDFNIDNVSSIKIKKITLSILNADNENNWTNAEAVAAGFQTKTGNANGKQIQIWARNINDVEAERFADQVIEPNDVNLKDYFNGSGEEVYYHISATARRATNKQLNVNAKIEYEVKF
ncbi:MAG TPA: hypothetical protein PL009_01510 [Flavipsychrobacter sp.]|nr:hypothetical protein [Flavipsychrobacter sp.]